MNNKEKVIYEGTLALAGGYRVIVISVNGTDRCFPMAPNGLPLARNGFTSIDQAKRRMSEFRDSGLSANPDRLAPSALPPDQRLALEPIMDSIMRVEIRGLYIVLLGILLGGDALLWILELPARTGTRTTKIFHDETEAVQAYEELVVELSTKYISTYLPDSGNDEGNSAG